MANSEPAFEHKVLSVLQYTASFECFNFVHGNFHINHIKAEKVANYHMNRKPVMHMCQKGSRFCRVSTPVQFFQSALHDL